MPQLSERELDLYEKHYSVLQSWNLRMALVSKKSIEMAAAVHYMDSIFTSELASKFVGDLRVSDLGSGAGFPGIVFAIRYPEKKVALYERSLKKQSFLTAALSQLELTNCEVRDAFPDKNPPTFLFARAVLPRDELLKFVFKVLPTGSVLVTSLGGKTEVPPVPKGFLKLDQKEYTLPGDHGSRKIEVLKITR